MKNCLTCYWEPNWEKEPHLCRLINDLEEGVNLRKFTDPDEVIGENGPVIDCAAWEPKKKMGQELSDYEIIEELKALLSDWYDEKLTNLSAMIIISHLINPVEYDDKRLEEMRNSFLVNWEKLRKIK